MSKRKYYGYMPMRFVFNMLLLLVEVALVIGLVVLIAIRSRYTLIAEVATQLAVAIAIVAGNDNPDYKTPWLLFVLIAPVVGFMCYFMFYSRKLNPVARHKLKKLSADSSVLTDSPDFQRLAAESPAAYSQANMLKKLSHTHIYTETTVTYYPLGDDMFPALLEDLKKAEKFIFMEYFIIQEGRFWNNILHILQEKAKAGLDVRVVYDDIGCMRTLPGDYYKRLRKMGIKSVPFSKLIAQANNKFNNRSHRKITVIDGKVGYTGGVNLADEYINVRERFGHWKDVGLRLEGNAVNELTRLFLADYTLNTAKWEDMTPFFEEQSRPTLQGYVVPFGDGPKPVYDRTVAKMAIINLLSQAQKYVYMMSPYLIIDSEMVQAIESAALRGVDVRLITPHIPDKKLVFTMTRSYYKQLMDAGVKVYEYTPGFVHAKVYLADGDTAIVGTINLDYRSLVHHFENGVWMHDVPAIADIERDFLATQALSMQADNSLVRQHLPGKFIRAIVKIFAPLL